MASVEEFVRFAEEMIAELTEVKRMKEAELEVCLRAIKENDEILTRWSQVLRDAQEAHGLPVSDMPIMDELRLQPYSQLGPTGLVERWSQENDGEVVVRELTRAAIQSGAYSDIPKGVRRYPCGPRQTWGLQVGSPGHYRRAQNPKAEARLGKLTSVVNPDKQQQTLTANFLLRGMAGFDFDVSGHTTSEDSSCDLRSISS